MDLVEEDTILLTGAWGSLGSFLLNVLCQSQRIKKVYALARRPAIGKKIRKAFEIRSLDKGFAMKTGKVEVLEYKM